MKPITTRTHGVIDYVVGILLILAPFILGFAHGGPEMWVPILLGAGTILYSMFTAYELGVVGSIPMRGHLTLDLCSGILLAVSPWLFGFSEIVWAPHLIVGLMEIVVSLMTQSVPQALPRRHAGRHA